MVENGAYFEPMDSGVTNELEARILAARDYVRVSDDLRPRVLETARSQWRDMRARGYIELAAVMALAASAVVAAFRSPSSPTSEPLSGKGRIADVRDSGHGSGPDRANWTLVDAFTELRRRQTETLRITRVSTRADDSADRDVFL